MYDYVVWMHKFQDVYLNYLDMLWFAYLAVDLKRYDEAFVWLKRIVFDYCENSKATDF